MTQIQFSDLQFDVPDNWNNESTLVFSMPPEDLSVPMVMQSQETRSTANVTVSWETFSGATPQEFLSARLEQIPQIFPGFEKQEEGVHGEGDEAIPFVQYKVPADPPFIQWVGVKQVEQRMVCITGTALESTFSRVKESFLSTAQSVGSS